LHPGEQLTEIASLIDSGRVRVAKVTEFAIEDYNQAYEKLESHHATGKIVINF
jgi:alcohol dehydrogenase